MTTDKTYCVKSAFVGLWEAAGVRLGAAACNSNCDCQHCRRQWTADQRLKYQLNQFRQEAERNRQIREQKEAAYEKTQRLIRLMNRK
jgi:hypothetical protein